MNRDCMLVVLSLLVQCDVLIRAEADHYLAVFDKMLEDGATMYSIDMVLEALNG